ncbi:DnaJ-domain-containing protein [Poronia punctata]|nr:DnaJ-domain-containing protein [Poronia punctata]
MDSFYDILRVARTASTREITAAYHNLARLYHPDRNPGRTAEATVAFQMVQYAYETLSNETSRRDYDDLYQSMNRLVYSEVQCRMREHARFNREYEEERKTRARNAEKREQQAAAEKEREKARSEEAERQKGRKGTCFHSSFCEVVQHKKKIVCDVCGVKRGMKAFMCPYCQKSLCQKCVGEFASSRAKEG